MPPCTTCGQAPGGGGGGEPTGAAGGDLAGTYPNPSIKPLVIVDGDINAAAGIAESKVSLASDAVAATASRRTLGTGAQQASPGDHGHTDLSDALAQEATDRATADALLVPRSLVDAEGDLLIGTAADTLDRLAKATRGGILVAGAARPQYLAKGTAGKWLRAGADDPEYESLYSAGTLASRPAAGVAGRHYLATNEGTLGTLYVDTGSAWTQVTQTQWFKLVGNAQSVTSSTDFVNMTDLQFAVVANERYEFRAHLGFVAATTGDVKLGLTLPVGSNAQWSALTLAQGAASTPAGVDVTFLQAAGEATGGGLGATAFVVKVEGQFDVMNAGTFAFKFAQRVSDASATVLQTGSFLVATRRAV